MLDFSLFVNIYINIVWKEKKHYFVKVLLMTDFLKNKKILVTGSEGFIGSHLTEYLVKEGYSVRAFVLYNSFNNWGWIDSLPKEIKSELDIFTGDVRDSNGVREAVKGCDIILHLAALIAIPYSYHSPDMYIDTNIKGTLNILQAARDLGVERVVHTSTSEVYGSAEYVPIDEKHPIIGQSPYSASKIGADQLAISFHKSFETPVSILRPFNTYGPRQSARAVIPTIITQLASGKTDIHLGDITPTRDFTYVKDTAKAFVEIASCDAAIGEVTNIGSNFEITIEKLALTIADIMGKEINIITDKQRIRPKDSEVTRLFSSTEKAQKLFGWNPEYGGEEGFRQGLENTIGWFTESNNLSLYKTDIYNV